MLFATKLIVTWILWLTICIHKIKMPLHSRQGDAGTNWRPNMQATFCPPTPAALLKERRRWRESRDLCWDKFEAALDDGDPIKAAYWAGGADAAERLAETTQRYDEACAAAGTIPAWGA